MDAAGRTAAVAGRGRADGLHADGGAHSDGARTVQRAPKRHRGATSLAVGPATASQVASRLETMIQEAATEWRRSGIIPEQDGEEAVRGAGWDHVVVTSSYSGMGCPEAALAWIRDALKDVGIALDVRFHGASDVSGVCRKVLRLHKPGSRAEHIFSDVQSLFPEEKRRTLEKLGKRYRDQVKASTKAAESAKGSEVAASVYRVETRRLGEKFFTRARQLLAEHTFDLSVRVWCDAHQRLCPFAPPVSEAPSLELEVAGTTCVAWSSMGSSWGWLDPSAVPCLVWCFWMRARRPHLIIHENTPRFDVGKLLSVLGSEAYAAASGVTSPADFGVPARRKRRYTVLCRVPEGAARWRGPGMAEERGGVAPSYPRCPCGSTSGGGAAGGLEVDGEAHAENWNWISEGDFQARVWDSLRCFFRQPILDCSAAFLVAAPGQVDSFLTARARRRNFGHDGDVRRDDGGVAPGRDVLAPADDLLLPPCGRAHLRAYKEYAAGGADLDFVYLLQSPYQSKPSCSATAPPLLRHTLLYSVRKERLVLPAELCLIQGIPSPSLMESEVSRRYPFEVALESCVTEGELRSLLGNGMHLCQSGGACLAAVRVAMEIA